MWNLWKSLITNIYRIKPSIYIRNLDMMIGLYNKINIKSTYLYTLKIKKNMWKNKKNSIIMNFEF